MDRKACVNEHLSGEMLFTRPFHGVKLAFPYQFSLFGLAAAVRIFARKFVAYAFVRHILVDVVLQPLLRYNGSIGETKAVTGS